jgi:anti-sigma factor RsiW
MLCEETRSFFSIYLDDVASLPMRAAVDEHLRACPVCRAHLAELRSVRQGLRALSRPAVPQDLAASICEAVAIEAEARRLYPRLSISVRLGRWLEPKLMPYTVGSFASVILFACMFSALRPHFQALHEATTQINSFYLVTPGPSIYDPVQDYATSRAPFAAQSPSLNPSGALAALTHSYARRQNSEPDQQADEMLVVADVFSNGSASLAGVVHPPRDRQMLADFEFALRQDAAFVPAAFDRRPDTMRVVFTVQKVDVRERNF